MDWLFSTSAAALQWCEKLLFTNIEWGANKLTAMVIAYYVLIIVIIYGAGFALSRLWRFWHGRGETAESGKTRGGER